MQPRRKHRRARPKRETVAARARSFAMKADEVKPGKGVKQEGKKCSSSQRNTTGRNGVQTDEHKPTYALCKDSHHISDCGKFMKMTLAERKHFVEKEHLCRGCLKKGHIWRHCYKKATCETCSRLHPSANHDEALSPKAEEEHSEQKVISHRVQIDKPETNYSVHGPHSLIVPVWLDHRYKVDYKVLVYALLDE